MSRRGWTTRRGGEGVDVDANVAGRVEIHDEDGEDDVVGHSEDDAVAASEEAWTDPVVSGQIRPRCGRIRPCPARSVQGGPPMSPPEEAMPPPFSFLPSCSGLVFWEVETGGNIGQNGELGERCLFPFGRGLGDGAVGDGLEDEHDELLLWVDDRIRWLCMMSSVHADFLCVARFDGDG